MALPANTLSSLPVKAEFLLPDATGRKSRIEDFERGGIALNDASQGLDVQDWRVRVVGTTIRIGAYPSGTETDLFLAAGVTEVSLAFDQLMRPAVAYVQSGVAKLYWYDTSIAAQSTLTVGAVRTPFLCLDDKRVTQTSTSDILLFYLAGTELRYRQQRDRFQIERTLATGIDGAAYINRCGMGTNLRLHIEIANAGKLQPRRGFMILRDDGADLFAGLGFRGVNGTLTAVETGTDSFEASGLLLSNAGTANWIEAGVDAFAAEGSLSSVAPDPDFNNVSLLLHMNGSDASTVFTDSSSRTKSLTRSGDPLISTAQSKFDGAAGLFNQGHISVSHNSDLVVGSNDFCIEFWLRLTGITQNQVLFNKQVGTASGYPYQAVLTTSRELIFRSFNSSGSQVFSTTTPTASVQLNTWAHLAFCRNGSSFTIYVNGTALATTSYSGILPDNTIDMQIGAYNTNSFPFVGYLDEFRFTKGLPRYTANFTPPTTPFPDTDGLGIDQYYNNVSLLLHADGANGSTTFTDYSPSQKTVTANANAKVNTSVVKYGTGSASFPTFNGLTDYLSIPSSSDFGFGAGEFTIEAWLYIISYTGSAYTAIVDIRNTASGNGAVLFYYDAVGRLGYYSNINLGTSTPVALNTWTHVALVRNASSTVTIYLNGVAQNSVNDGTSKNSNQCYIGRVYDAAHRQIHGYIDDLRITKGVARYTGNFTPPTAAFPDVGPSLTTLSLVAALDAKSYTSGQTWANSVAAPADSSSQTAYDYLLGTTSASQASDPTITGAGADAAYWAFNGNQFFTHTLAAASMPAFLRTMHHAGQKWTIEIWMQWAGSVAGNVHPVFDSGTSDQGGGDMSRGVMFADLGNGADGVSGKLKFRVKRDSSAVSAWVRNSDANLPSGSVQMVAVSWDATGLDPSFLYRNGNYEASSGNGAAGNTWTVSGATFGTTNAANSARIAARGDGNFIVPNGTRVYIVRLYNRNLTKAELDANWNGTKARFGL